MAKDEVSAIGIIRLILILVLVLLVLHVVALFLDFAVGGFTAKIIMIVIIILGVIWLLSKDGEAQLRKLLKDLKK